MPILSIIIPIKEDEKEHLQLLDSLDNISTNNIEIISSKGNGRAVSLNSGAKKSSGEHLLFLHADSKVTPTIIDDLLKNIKEKTDSLLFFDLAFYDSKSLLMKLTESGANFRSHIFKSPYGDQGLCIKRELFDKIGGYDEDVEYGEDHLFVWKARQNNIEITPINSKLYTSARKYKKNGWFKTTLLHQYLWIKQAYPEWIKLKRTRNQ